MYLQLRAVSAVGTTSARILITRARDVQVDTIRVVLSAVRTLLVHRRVKGDNLVAKDVIAGKTSRDSDGPRIGVICVPLCYRVAQSIQEFAFFTRKLVRGPVALVASMARRRDQTLRVNEEELQLFWPRPGTVIIGAASKVCKDLLAN